MSSFGSLVFYGKNGVSDPYSLSYGKTTIGSSSNHHIRIKVDNRISCVLDTNEFGVTTLINEPENESVLVNNVQTEKYTILHDGDHIEFGRIKFKYSNPSLDEKYLEQTKQTLIKKRGISENIRTKLDIPSKLPTPLKRLQSANSTQRRFSTGCKISEVKSSPRITKKTLTLSSQTSTPQSASKVRFSQRMVARRNSTLASVKENEVFDFQNPLVNFVASPIPKKNASFLVESPLAKKNKTFAGSSKLSTPLPSKNKTYSGNISDVSEGVTTPENNVTAAAITPLNVSKKSKKSLNRSRTLSYVDFPDNSSTPKSAIKMNRSSSLYRPIVEDITPASPLPRSSLRNSSLKKPAFTQRRSVNVSNASHTDNSTMHSLSLPLEEETSLSGSKRKRIESSFECLEDAKRQKNDQEFDIDDHDQNSLHDSSLSGIHNLSDNSFHSNKNLSTNLLSVSRSLKDVATSEGKDIEDQSVVSWHEEMPHNDPTPSADSAITFSSFVSSKSRRSSVQKQKGRSDVRSKSLNLDIKKSKSPDKHSKTLGNDPVLTLEKSCNDPSDYVETAIAFSSSFMTSRSRRSGGKKNLRSKSLILDRKISRPTEKHSKTLGQNISLSDEEISSNNLTGYVESSSSVLSRSPASRMQKIKLNTRSQSLNLDRKMNKSTAKGSKTLGNDWVATSSDEKSVSSMQPSLIDQSLESSDEETNVGKISSTPLVKTRSKSLGFKSKSPGFQTRSKSSLSRRRMSVSLGGSSKTTNRASLNVSPIAVLKGSRNSSRRALSPGDSTKKLFGSLLDASLPEYNDSTNKLFLSNKESSVYTINSLTPGRLTRTSRILKNISPKSSSHESDTSIANSTATSVFKTPKRLSTLESKSSSSFIVSDYDSEPLKVVKTVSFCDSSSMEDVDVNREKSTVSEKVFKTPKTKTPNKSVSDPTDVRSIEKLFEKSLDKTPRKPIRSSNSIEEALANLVGQESENSLGESSKSAGRKTPISARKQKTPIEKAGTKKPVSPQNDLTDVAGVRELLRTPRIRSSPKNDLSNVVGVKKIMATPKVPNSSRNDLTDVAGVKKLLRTPRAPQSPYNDLSNIEGIKKLLKTPKVHKSPRNDLTDIVGVKTLLKTPRVKKSPRNDLTNIKGVKTLLKTPKVQKSPRNDLTNVAGVKNLLKSPVVGKSPKNDLTDIKGVKKLMTTPKAQNSPKNDLTNVAGVKKLMSTPKERKSPKNDLTQVAGLKKLLASPKQQKTPKNDLEDVKGVKKIFKTPKAQKTPKNELIDVRGIKQLLKTPKNKAADESHDLSGIDILFDESQENSFDRLLGKKPVRTYGKSPKINKSQEIQAEKVKTPEHVLKWLEEQSEIKQTTPKEKIEVKRGKRKLADATEALEENSSSASKKLKPTYKTRSANVEKDKNESVDISISCSIVEKPGSTPKKSESPVISTDNKRQTRKKNVSKSEIVETETKPTRSRKKTENVEVAKPPSPRKTRSKANIENEPAPKGRGRKKKQEEENVEDCVSEVGKRGRGNRGKGTETKTIEQDKNTEKEVEESSITEKDSQSKKRGRPKAEDNTVKETVANKRRRNNKKNEKDEEVPVTIKRREDSENTDDTNTKEEAGESSITEKDSQSAKRGKTKAKDNTEKETATNKRRRNNKKNEKDEEVSVTIKQGKDNENTDDINTNEEVGEKSVTEKDIESKKRGKPKAKDNTEKQTAPNTRRRNNKKNEKDEEVSEPKKQGEDNENTDDKNTNEEVGDGSVTEKDSQSKKRGKSKAKDNTEKETATNKRRRNNKKNEKDEEVSVTIKQGEVNESIDEKNGLVTRSTRSNKGKNQKYNEDEWDTPVKKQRLVTFKEETELLQTPIDATKDITSGVRVLRKRKAK